MAYSVSADGLRRFPSPPFITSAGGPLSVPALPGRGPPGPPASAVTDSVEDDPSARWYVLVGDEGFAEIDVPPEGADIVLLVRRPAAKEPAWHVLFRDILKVDGFAAAPGESAGAILFVRTTG